jgi:uncharacterized damage-inducible protein DinB
MAVRVVDAARPSRPFLDRPSGITVRMLTKSRYLVLIHGRGGRFSENQTISWENPMSYAETILPEFDQEMANTRKVLERIPDDKLDWKPHPKSHTIGWNANHVADLPNWLVMVLNTPSLDIAPVGGQAYTSPKLSSRQDILELFDRNVAAARKAITEVKEADAGSPWSLLQAGNPIFTMPRSAVIRSMVLNHLMHHRAHLLVYLRLNDVPVPGMYGPSGDE